MVNIYLRSPVMTYVDGEWQILKNFKVLGNNVIDDDELNLETGVFTPKQTYCGHIGVRYGAPYIKKPLTFMVMVQTENQLIEQLRNSKNEYSDDYMYINTVFHKDASYVFSTYFVDLAINFARVDIDLGLF